MPLYFDVNFNDMLKINTAMVGEATMRGERPYFGEDGGLNDREGVSIKTNVSE